MGRVRQIGTDLTLMAAQLVDLPFSFISELDKNVIGVAAFMKEIFSTISVMNLGS